MYFSFTFGRPPFLPLALALSNPSFVRWTIRSRSNWLNAWKTVNMSFPCGVCVSKFSFKLISFTPFCSKYSTSSIKSLVLLPNLEKLSTIKVSPVRILSFNLINSGLSFFVPDIFSVRISVQLQVFNKSN